MYLKFKIGYFNGFSGFFYPKIGTGFGKIIKLHGNGMKKYFLNIFSREELYKFVTAKLSEDGDTKVISQVGEQEISVHRHIVGEYQPISFNKVKENLVDDFIVLSQ